MPAAPSYASMLANRPMPSAASKRQSLLSTTTPPKTRPLSSAHDTSTSTSAIADSPRRLLSYYLSKAAYNTEEAVSENGQQGGEAVAKADAGTHMHSREASWTADREREVAPSKSLVTSPSQPLRPPPFLRTSFSRGLRTGAGSAETLRPQPATDGPSRPSFALPTTPRIVKEVGAAPPTNRSNAVDAAARGVETAAALTAINTTTTSQVPLPQPSSPRAVRQSEAASPSVPAVPIYGAVYTEEQQRVFEAAVMHQVEALLQAQRGESYAELERHRVLAEEAEATLRAVDEALAEQLDSRAAAVAAVVHAAPVASSHESMTRARERTPQPQQQRHPRVAAAPVIPVEVLAADMASVAASAVPAATQHLLDVIMNIQDGQHVPSVLQSAVQELYDSFTRALVPCVMAFVTAQPERGAARDESLYGVDAAAQEGSQGTPLMKSDSGADRAALDGALAEAAALRDEVAVLRRTLDGRVRTGCVASPSPSTSAPSSDRTQQALLDRFYTECHAMLTRCRQEGLSLRRRLEKERRRHFLSRLQLLKAAPPVLAPHTSVSRAHKGAPTSAAHELMAPQLRSTTASHAQAARGEATPSEFPRADVSQGWSPAVFPTPHRSLVDGGADGPAAQGDAQVVGDAPQQPRVQAASHTPAEGVRRTAAARDGSGATAAHPYNAYSSVGWRGRDGHSGDVETSRTGYEHDREELLASVTQRPMRGSGGPSVSFADPTSSVPLAAEEDMGGGRSYNHNSNNSNNNSRRGAEDGYSKQFHGEHSNSVAARSRGAYADASGYEGSLRDSAAGAHVKAVSAVFGERPQAEHEKRVWNKAVELLSRYSVA